MCTLDRTNYVNVWGIHSSNSNVPALLERVVGIKLKMSEDLQNNSKVSQFEH